MVGVYFAVGKSGKKRHEATRMSQVNFRVVKNVAKWNNSGFFPLDYFYFLI